MEIVKILMKYNFLKRAKPVSYIINNILFIFRGGKAPNEAKYY